MKKLIRNFVKVAYSYEKTKIKTNKFNLLVSFCFKNKIMFSNNSMQLCLIKNKILPFFENLANNKQIRPLFYSNNVRNFGTLKSISKICGGLVFVGKWHCSLITRKKQLELISKDKSDLQNQNITMLIAPNSYFCQSVIKEANSYNITSFGSLNFGDPIVTNVTYFVIGSKNNLNFSIKFFLLLSYLIKWKTHLNFNVKKQQNYNYLLHGEYIRKLKNLKKICEITANTSSNSNLKNKHNEKDKKKIKQMIETQSLCKRNLVYYEKKK